MTETLATAARHSKATPRWGTPANWVAMARRALGGRIDLDPMSESTFNDVVQARRFFCELDDGLKRPWLCATMLINPAGGLVVEAWRKLCSEYGEGHVRRAIWIGFSVEQLNLLADESWHPDDFSKLTVRKRISFNRHDGYKGSPSHANYVVGLGIAAGLFEQAFSGMGRFHHGRLALHGGRTEAA
jgi:hypothetical protein